MESTEGYGYPPEEVEEEDRLDFYEYMVDGVLLAIVCFFGIIANIFVIFVLSRPQMKMPINCYLLHLAVYDMLFLIGKVVLHVIHVFATYDENKTMQIILDAMYPIPMYIFSVLIYISRMGSIWTTIGVSVERYIVVCHPLKAITFCSYGRTVFANFLIAFLVVCYNIPQFFAYEVTYRHITDEVTNETVTIGDVILTSFGESYFYNEVYETWMNITTFNIIPIFSLLFLNISIYRKIRISRNVRKESTQKQETDTKLSFLLLCIVVIFFICYTPSFIFAIASSAGLSESISKHLPATLHLTEGINSSVNFIVYCVMARSFRNMVLRLFCRRNVTRTPGIRKKKEKPESPRYIPKRNVQ